MAAESQESLMQDSKQAVAKQQFQMQRKLDEQNLKEAIKYSIHMIFELKHAKLSPAKYYELYMQVISALQDLTVYIEDEASRDKSQEEMEAYLDHYYEYVQYTGNIIPRLYLLNCVGGVYLKLQKDPEKRMKRLNDMKSMTKGVQHPTRGLFLRNYLSQVSKEYLPDVENEEEDPSLPILDGITFILENFGEMTQLWVRMQHQGAVRDRGKREKERLQLRMLVGTTLRRLVELTAVTKERYQEKIFPQIQKIVISCKDKIAQEYLMDCIIMVFSDEYHLATLEEFLRTCTKLVSSVNIKNIVVSLMDRLAKFAADNPRIFSEKDVFPIFQEQCAHLVTKKKKMALSDKLELEVSLINFATRCYPEKYEYIIGVWETILKLVRKLQDKGKGAQFDDKKIRGHMVDLLTRPVQSMKLAALDWEEYPVMMELLGFERQREAATQIARHLVNAKAILSSTEQVERLFKILVTLLHDQAETPDLTPQNRHEFDDEQYLIANLIGQIEADDPDDHFECLGMARTYFAKGGEDRQKITFPCLHYNALKLIRKAVQAKKDEPRYTIKKMFKFLNQILTHFQTLNQPQCIRMYLDAAMGADECGYDTAVYGFIEAAFELFEDIGDSKEERRIMQSITGTLMVIQSIDEENFDTLRQQAVQHCSRLLKKPFQAQAVCKAGHLFWNCQNEEFRNEDLVLKCLTKAGKIAKGIMQEVEKARVYITILNEFLYFFDQQCPKIESSQINSLGLMVRGILDEIEEDEDGLDDVRYYYRNTIRYVKEKKTENELFGEIQLE